MLVASFLKRGYLTSEDFCELTGVSKNIIYVARNSKNPYVIKVGNSVLVNYKELLRRREFHHKIWLEAHNNYYAIVEHISENKLNWLINRYLKYGDSYWANYMAYGLFSSAFMDKSLLSYKIPYRLWSFYRFTTFLIRRLLKHENKRIVNKDM